MYLGVNISTIRSRFKFKKNEFEEYMNAPKNQMGKYEKETAMPSIEFLLKLEEISGVPIYAMFYKQIDPLQLPATPIDVVDHSLLEQSAIQYGLTKDESAELSELKDKIIKLLEENRDLRIENNGLREWIEEKRKMDKK